MLYLLADTSVWLDLAKNINGQKLIVTVRVLAHEGRLTLLVPSVVIDEFERNRQRVESDVTRSVSAQLGRARGAIEQHGQGYGRHAALKELDNLSHRLPLINQMATRNFDDVRQLPPATASWHRRRRTTSASCSGASTSVRRSTEGKTARRMPSCSRCTARPQPPARATRPTTTAS